MSVPCPGVDIVLPLVSCSSRREPAQGARAGHSDHRPQRARDAECGWLDFATKSGAGHGCAGGGILVGTSSTGNAPSNGGFEAGPGGNRGFSGF